MRNIALVFLFLFSSFILYPKNGFEFNFSINGGGTFSFADQKYKDNINESMKKTEGGATLNSGIGFSTGISLQPGYFISISSNIGVSILLDLAYRADSYFFKAKQDLFTGHSWGGDVLYINFKETNTTPFFILTDIQIGLYPKFYIGNFAIGIGGGIKIPFIAFRTTQRFAQDENNQFVTDKINNVTISILTKDIFKSMVGGYIKLSLDYLIYMESKTAFTIGVYFGYDFNYNLKLDTIYVSDGGFYYYFDDYLTKFAISKIDFGLQFGFRYGPKP